MNIATNQDPAKKKNEALPQNREPTVLVQLLCGAQPPFAVRHCAKHAKRTFRRQQDAPSKDLTYGKRQDIEHDGTRETHLVDVNAARGARAAESRRAGTCERQNGCLYQNKH